MSTDCPCGSGLGYDECCAEVHRSGAGLGAPAEALMRARYSAYVRHDADFLLGSWHPDTRPATIEFDDDIEWLGLEILETGAGTAFHNHGTVEFLARFRRDGEYTSGPMELSLTADGTATFTYFEGSGIVGTIGDDGSPQTECVARAGNVWTGFFSLDRGTFEIFPPSDAIEMWELAGSFDAAAATASGGYRLAPNQAGQQLVVEIDFTLEAS